MTKTALKNTLGWILTIFCLGFLVFLSGVIPGSNPFVIGILILFIGFAVYVAQAINTAIVNKATDIKTNFVKKIKGQK